MLSLSLSIAPSTSHTYTPKPGRTHAADQYSNDPADSPRPKEDRSLNVCGNAPTVQHRHPQRRQHAAISALAAERARTDRGADMTTHGAGGARRLCRSANEEYTKTPSDRPTRGNRGLLQPPTSSSRGALHDDHTRGFQHRAPGMGQRYQMVYCGYCMAHRVAFAVGVRQNRYVELQQQTAMQCRPADLQSPD